MAAPTIHTQSASFTVYEGQTARFYVVAAGRGTITYQWEKSDNSGGSWSDVIGATSSSYTTAATVRTSDNGDQYRCKVTNGDGTTTGTAITLTVWNPLAIGTDLALWARAGTGMFTERTSPTTSTSNGGVVGTWRGINGASANVDGSAPSDAARPIYRLTGIYGQPAIEFDGTDDCLNYTTALAALTNGASYGYIFAAVAPTTGATERHVMNFGNNANTGTRAVLGTNSGGTAGTLLCGGRRLDANSFAGTTYAAGQLTDEPCVLGVEYLWASSDLHLRKNGARIASNTSWQTDGTVSATNAGGVYVGASQAGGGNFFDGMIAQVIVVKSSSELSSGTIALIEGFLQAKIDQLVFDWNLNSRAVGATVATTYNKGIVRAPDANTPLENDPVTHKYCHANAITVHNGRIHVCYASMALNEDAGGQQVCWCYSDDNGATWSSPQTLLTSQSAWVNTNDAFPSGAYVGLVRRWVQVNGRLFCTFGVDEYSGIGTGWLGAKGVMLAAREIFTDGTLGTLVRISSADYTALDGKTKLNYDSDIAALIYDEADVFGIWGGTNPGLSPASDWGCWLADSTQEYAELVTAFRSGVNELNLIRTCRDVTNNTAFVYQSESTDGGANWGTLRKTNWPSSPQVTWIMRLNSGNYAMLGNTDASRTELYLAIVDGTTLKATTIRQVEYNTDTLPEYPGTYKNGGPSYPCAVQRGNYLYCTWSLQKEQIWFARVLIPGESDNSNHAASIAVTAPTLDQQVTSGTIASITATTSGTSGTYHVYLSFDGGFSFPLQIGTSVSLPYSWSVADSHIQSNAMIRVVDSSDSNIIGDSLLFDVIESSGSGSSSGNLLLLGVG